jgi:hypothetical protein
MTDKDEQKIEGAKPWTTRVLPVEVGDRVCYSKKFLQSTGQYTGSAPMGRGIVTALVPLGSTTLAEIEWNDADLPSRVNVANLSRVTDKGIMEPN